MTRRDAVEGAGAEEIAARYGVLVSTEHPFLAELTRQDANREVFSGPKVRLGGFVSTDELNLARLRRARRAAGLDTK